MRAAPAVVSKRHLSSAGRGPAAVAERPGGRTKASGQECGEHHPTDSGHAHMLDRLRNDIRVFVHNLHEFSELPDKDGPVSWERHVREVLAGVDVLMGQPSSNKEALENIEKLLNCRDRILSVLVTTCLYSKAVLDDELGLVSTAIVGQVNESARKGGAQEVDSSARVMQQLRTYVCQLRQHSKYDAAPEKYVLQSSICEPGHEGYFTFSKKEKIKYSSEHRQSHLQNSLFALTDGLQCMDRRIRELHSGQAIMCESGEAIPAGDLRKEIATIFDQCLTLRHELQMTKAMEHAAQEEQVETRLKLEEAEKDIRLNSQRIVKAEADVQALKAETALICREKAELSDRHAAMVDDFLPLLDGFDRQLILLQERDVELKDCAWTLTQMLARQADDDHDAKLKRNAQQRDLVALTTTLRQDRMKNQLKDVELSKKEVLGKKMGEMRVQYLEDYERLKCALTEAMEQLDHKVEEWRAVGKEIALKRDVMKKLRAELKDMNQEINSLEDQKRRCLHRFHSQTGSKFPAILRSARRLDSNGDST